MGKKMRRPLKKTSSISKKEEEYIKVSEESKVEAPRRVEKNDRKGATIFNGIFSDFMSELYQTKGAYMWQTKTLPWKIHPKMLINSREILTNQREKGEISDNIRRVSVAAIPTFPSREFDGVEYLKIVFVHIKQLAKDTIDEIIKVAIRARTKIIGHRQTEVRDTCIVVIADNQERGANIVMQHKARMKATTGTRICYVFGTRQGVRIRKLLYGFLGNYFNKRAEAVEAKAEKTLQKAGSTEGVYGALKDCCEFVAGLGTKLKELAGRIKLPWGARKTREERTRDKIAVFLNSPEGRAEDEAKVRKEMRELSKAEMLKKDRGKAISVTAT